MFSANLSDPTADLAVLARLTNLSGAGGFAQMPATVAEHLTAPYELDAMYRGVVKEGLTALFP